ncbi:CU044_5270 family protein [Amycolatopsis speibonae]|uniref:CU044_5270 family protein n=1 Tax=Amycolatopsis speibonae TaxID=1450224 RepID=A0ABV7NVB1_9PSEU
MHGGNIRKVWSDAELDEALADLHSEPDTRQDELSRARAALLRAAGEAEVEDELRPLTAPPVRKRPGAWRWIAAAAAAALVSGGGIVATNAFVGDDAPAPAAPATIAPGDDALKYLRSTDLPLTDKQYRLLTESVWTTRFGKKSGLIYQTHEILERWIPSRGDRPVKTRYSRTGEVRWIKGDYDLARTRGELIPGATVETGWESSGGPPGPHSTSSPQVPPATTTTNSPPEAPVSTRWKQTGSGWTTPTKEFLADLPADPTKLLDRLMHDNRSGQPLDKTNTAPEMFEMVFGALRMGHGFGDLRVALCKALARVPGVAVDTSVSTPDNGPGVSFSVTLPDRIRTFIVDLKTAEVVRNRAAPNPAESGPALFDTKMSVVITDDDGPEVP